MSRPKTFDPIRSLGIKAKDPAKAERDAFYSSKRWMRFRDVFLRENPLCVRCLDRDVLTPATIAHHIIERLVRPDLAYEPSNISALCGSCHSTHHNRSRRRVDA